MPLDNTGGAPAPSAWTDYLARLKLARRARTRDAQARRRVTQQRLALAEFLLGRIIDGADFLAEVERERQSQAEKAVCLFVTMSFYDFKKLCGHGAEFEDFEDTDGGEDQQDLEPDVDDEASLVPASDSHFRFEKMRDDALEDGEKGDAPAEKVEAFRRRLIGRPLPYAEIRTGAGELVGREGPDGVVRFMRRVGP